MRLCSEGQPGLHCETLSLKGKIMHVFKLCIKACCVVFICSMISSRREYREFFFFKNLLSRRMNLRGLGCNCQHPFRVFYHSAAFLGEEGYQMLSSGLWECQASTCPSRDVSPAFRFTLLYFTWHIKVLEFQSANGLLSPFWELLHLQKHFILDY